MHMGLLYIALNISVCHAAQWLGDSWTKARYCIIANIVSSGAAKKISPFVNFKVFMLFSRNNPHSSHEEGD